MLSRSVVSSSLWPQGLQPARLLCPWDSPGKNTRVDCHFLLQRIYPTQGLNTRLICFGRQTLHLWATWGTPKPLCTVPLIMLVPAFYLLLRDRRVVRWQVNVWQPWHARIFQGFLASWFANTSSSLLAISSVWHVEVEDLTPRAYSWRLMKAPSPAFLGPRLQS